MLGRTRTVLSESSSKRKEDWVGYRTRSERRVEGVGNEPEREKSV